MEIEYHEAKRLLILEDRGLDISRSVEVFEAFNLVRRDDKHSSSLEERFHSIGPLDDDIVIVTWTQRGEKRRIVTMWKANDREREKYHQQRDRPG